MDEINLRLIKSRGFAHRVTGGPFLVERVRGIQARAFVDSGGFTLNGIHWIPIKSRSVAHRVKGDRHCQDGTRGRPFLVPRPFLKEACGFRARKEGTSFSIPRQKLHSEKSALITCIYIYYSLTFRALAAGRSREVLCVGWGTPKHVTLQEVLSASRAGRPESLAGLEGFQGRRARLPGRPCDVSPLHAAED